MGAAQPPPQDTVQVREGLVLITEHVGKKPLAEGSSAVLAAPGSVRRAADKTVVRCGPASVAHPVLPPQVSVVPTGPQQLAMDELLPDQG